VFREVYRIKSNFYYLWPLGILFFWLLLFSINLITASIAKQGCELQSVRGITAFMVAVIPILTFLPLVIGLAIYECIYKSSDNE